MARSKKLAETLRLSAALIRARNEQLNARIQHLIDCRQRKLEFDKQVAEKRKR